MWQRQAKVNKGTNERLATGRKEPGDAADEQDRVDQFITPTLSRAVRVVV
jgi:hypothetical protein